MSTTYDDRAKAAIALARVMLQLDDTEWGERPKLEAAIFAAMRCWIGDSPHIMPRVSACNALLELQREVETLHELWQEERRARDRNRPKPTGDTPFDLDGF